MNEWVGGAWWRSYIVVLDGVDEEGKVGVDVMNLQCLGKAGWLKREGADKFD